MQKKFHTATKVLKALYQVALIILKICQILSTLNIF